MIIRIYEGFEISLDASKIINKTSHYIEEELMISRSQKMNKKQISLLHEQPSSKEKLSQEETYL